MKYKKITCDDVYKVLVRVHLNIMGFGCINVINIASLLKTSRYQAKKYIDELKRDGMVELECINLSDDEELYPPYWGYMLTEKGRDTGYYRKSEEKEIALIKGIFEQG